MASERQISVGGVLIGAGAPVAVQSMTTTKTHDVEATMAQVDRLFDAGVDIVRVAVPGIPDADALPEIIERSRVPIIADIHFNASLALRALDAGVAAVRINPGNIGGPDKVEKVVKRAKETGTPMRIGANSGSLPDHLRWTATADPAGALVKAAMEEVEILERLDFHDFKISVKSSSVPVMMEAYRRLSEVVPYPLHLGVTEAGTMVTGTVKSSLGIGAPAGDGDRGHAARLAHHRPGRGGARRLRDPEGARPAPVRPDADRVPVLRAHERRGARAGRAGRDAARRPTASTSRSR